MNEQDKSKQLESEFKECSAVLVAIGDEIAYPCLDFTFLIR